MLSWVVERYDDSGVYILPELADPLLQTNTRVSILCNQELSG